MTIRKTARPCALLALALLGALAFHSHALAAPPTIKPAQPAARARFKPATTVWLDQLDLRYVVCGYGETRARRTTYNHELVIVDQKYERGLGWHAPGSIVMRLPDCGARFYCEFGISDETQEQGHVNFLVYSDGEKLWESGFVTGKDRARVCDLELKNRSNLVIIADEGPEGYGNDHAVLGDARIELDDNAQETVRNLEIVRPIYLGPNGRSF